MPRSLQTLAEPVAVRDGRLNARTRPFPVTGTRSAVTPYAGPWRTPERSCTAPHGWTAPAWRGLTLRRPVAYAW